MRAKKGDPAPPRALNPNNLTIQKACVAPWIGVWMLNTGPGLAIPGGETSDVATLAIL